VVVPMGAWGFIQPHLHVSTVPVPQYEQLSFLSYIRCHINPSKQCPPKYHSHAEMLLLPLVSTRDGGGE
jgi:hypothetical protein